MAKKKLTPVKKRSVKAPINQSNAGTVLGISVSGEGLQIETNPPPATWGGRGNLKAYLHADIDITVPRLRPGQAFLIPASNRAPIRKYLTHSYPNKLFVINKIPGNSNQLRVYYIRDLAPKTT